MITVPGPILRVPAQTAMWFKLVAIVSLGWLSIQQWQNVQLPLGEINMCSKVRSRNVKSDWAHSKSEWKESNYDKSWQRLTVGFALSIATLSRLSGITSRPRLSPPGELRQRAARAVEDEVRQQLQKDVPEEALQQKSKDLSNDRRAVGTREARAALATRFQVAGLVEWVHKDKAGGYGLVLEQGEPSRLCYESVKKEVNWALFVISRLQTPPAGIQLYPDRGPKTRQKGKGKGGKGKGRGRKGGKGKEPGRGRGNGAD